MPVAQEGVISGKFDVFEDSRAISIDLIKVKE
jgi:hypothetical protein